ncbi:hypothetical protein FDP41_010055 [Naegleria fowleri]|uniref:BTB domain-containing protein n=1 Tax=Naegleria fowleri TaxID=5763 RepID=A0A6A5B9K0_NAEFO|nr:uncharacterized protein FDP41_010055 [Naegleria fowleri]KAF0971832.1 hypothetical protein FDP41_010055 [Naegleria fowleri]
MNNFLKVQLEKQALGDIQGYDTVLKFTDNRVLYVHRCVLAARSAYFSNIFKESNTQEDGKLLIEISNYHLESIQILISFLYTDNISFPDNMYEHYLQEIVEICGMDHRKHEIFADIYNRKKLYMDSSASVIYEIEEDLIELYQSVEHSVDNIIEELCHNNFYADVTIQILDPHTNDIMHQLRVHKLFIARSTYIEAVFAPNMEESTTGVMKFNEVSLKGILCVLRYLYTNKIDIPIEIAIEVFICSHLFQLNEISQHAKRIVIENITIDNALDIAIIADMYNEHGIKNHCIKKVVDHYDEFSKLSHFHGLSEPIKTEIHDKYVYQLKKKSKQIKTKNRKQDENSK